jgi:membrane-associated phospholipid phosphatase
VAATLWRRDWRRGLVICLLTGLWVVAQVSCGVRYPLDVIAGTLLGISLGWLLGAIAWLDRLLGALVHLARRLMLA